MKKALVCGAGGFIGHHLVNQLKGLGYWVLGVDIKYPVYESTKADKFTIADLTVQSNIGEIFLTTFDEVYQLAADMGGAGYIFTGVNDAHIMHNSSMINLNILNKIAEMGAGKVFFSSSACIYPAYNQTKPDDPKCNEDSAYPAQPDSEYGWEKLFSERLYMTYGKIYNLDVKIGRFHNIFGPMGTYRGGKEKAPAAMCRKIIEAIDGDIEIWGDGQQTRSFLYIDECLVAIRKLMDSTYNHPVNIGSEEMISINDLVKMVSKIAGKPINIGHKLDGPTGVRGRNSDNKLISEVLGWKPNKPLEEGMTKTYDWIKQQYEQL